MKRLAQIWARLTGDSPLHRVLLAAQRDARPVEATATGTTRREGKPDQEWSYAPAVDVAAEARRLMRAHELLILLDACVVTGKSLRAVYRLVHVPSGAWQRYTSETPLNEGMTDPTHATAATERYAWRCLVLRLFEIPVVPRAPMRAATFAVAAPRPVAAHTPSLLQPTPPPPPPPYTPGRLCDAFNAWADNEQALSLDVSPPALTFEDAMARYLGSAGGRPDKRRPADDSEREELYLFLVNEAALSGYLIERAA